MNCTSTRCSIPPTVFFVVCIAILFGVATILYPVEDAFASENPNLSVSAESEIFENHFAGSMVIEVSVSDPSLSDTRHITGEPSVNINGVSLRMTQASNGNWYAYFANLGAAQTADQISFDAGTPGQGLDFGVFCASSSLALGTSFEDSNAVAIPRADGLDGYSNGGESYQECTGSISDSGTSLNNVVRSPPSINRGSDAVPSGQIGLVPSAWPLIQLFSFSGTVNITYEHATGTQKVRLQYDDIPNISHTIDRDVYPAGSDVFLTIHDMQLNQDPTDKDSWTFQVGSSKSGGDTAIFYQAFDDNGRNAANGGSGLVDLGSHLSRLGFDDNGSLKIDTSPVLSLVSNKNQPSTYVTDGTSEFHNILTVVETGSDTAIFSTSDSKNLSGLKIANDSPRGHSGVIQYNDRSLSVLTSSSTASLSFEPRLEVDSTSDWRSGTRVPVKLYDPDQDISTTKRDILDASVASSIIPTIQIGSPLTLRGASDVTFYPSEYLHPGYVAKSHVPDPVSARLYIDSTNLAVDTQYEKFSIDLGFSASMLDSALISTNDLGSSWLYLDMRSLARDLGLGDITISLYFRDINNNDGIINIINRINPSSPHLVMLDPDDIVNISQIAKRSPSTAVYAMITIDSSSGLIIPKNNNVIHYPIMLDFFSFGLKDNKVITNNAIYRLELEENSVDSGTFVGTLEFAATNQLSMFDPDFVMDQITPTGDDVKFIILDSMTGKDGITISYSDLAKVGVVTVASSPKTDASTSSGYVSFSAPSNHLWFGTPITIELYDPDLNTSADTKEIYYTVNDPASPAVDTVGKNGNILLEIKFKDIRYKRCVINGDVRGGLASTGFTLIETGINTGAFEGLLKMPTWICNESGTELISPSGGSIDIIYHDSNDKYGNPNTFSLLRNAKQPISDSSSSSSSSTGTIQDDISENNPLGNSPSGIDPLRTFAALNTYVVLLPEIDSTREIILSGDVGLNTRGMPLVVTLTHPDGIVQTFSISVTNLGLYKAVLTVGGASTPIGTYIIDLEYNDKALETLSFLVLRDPITIPNWFKDVSERWSLGSTGSTDQTYDDFAYGLGQLADLELLTLPNRHILDVPQLDDVMIVPDWIKISVGLWVNNHISDDQFILLVQYLVDEQILSVHTRS